MVHRHLVRGLGAALLAASFLPGCASADESASKAAGDPRATEVVRQMIDAMGGQDALQKTGALKFTFTYTSKDTLRTERTHWWDRMTGRYRIEGLRKGEPYVLLFNTQTRDGRVFVNGKELEGAEKADLLKRAYALFINDTYWFLMPAKLFDPGVHLQMDGEGTVNGSPVDRVKVTFDNVGLTPGDTYWAYIDRQTHLMTRWGMILEGDRDKPDVKEAQYDWTDWKAFGPLTLSTDRVKVEDPDRTRIGIRGIEVADSFADPVFTDPAPLQVGVAH